MVTLVTFTAVGIVRTMWYRLFRVGFRLWVGSLFAYIKLLDWKLWASSDIGKCVASPGAQPLRD